MYTATENHQPANSSIRRLVACHPVAAFLVMLYAIGWIIFLPVVLSQRGLLVLPVDLSEGFAFNTVTSLASILGIALPAFLVTAATGGKAGIRDLLHRCFRWRVGIGWYLIALFGLPVATLLIASVSLGLAPFEALAQKWPLLFTLFLPEVLVPFVFIQIFEEAGWTGFMQHTLQERHGPLLASIMVAPAFVLQHLPLLPLNEGAVVLLLMGAGVIMAVFFRIVIMWLYNGAGRSVLVVALFHSAFNSATSLGGQKFIGELISGSAMLYALAVVAVFAVLLIVFTRGRLSYRPDRPSQPADAAPQGGTPVAYP